MDAIEAELFPPQLPQQVLQASPQYQPDAAQVQQHLDALHHEDDGYSPTEMAESEYDPFTEQFMAEFGEVYERRYPENAPAEERRRCLRGKQTVPARLQVLNLAGGECRGGSTRGGGDEKSLECQGCGLLQYHHCPPQDQQQGALRKFAFCNEVQEVEDAEFEVEESEDEEAEWGEMKVQQDWAMSKLIGEEMALIDGIDADQQIWMKTLTKVHEERMKLEEEILEKKQEEVLQGYTVSNQEVRNNWEDWKAPIDKELSTLLENGAISPITKQQRDELVQQYGTRMECIPSKIVAVVKAGGKKRRGWWPVETTPQQITSRLRRRRPLELMSWP